MMKLIWQIEAQDVERVRAFVAQYRENAFVQLRIKRNVEGSKPEVSRDDFWYAMISCLLTTQQRSGPDSAVGRFTGRKPFSLAYSGCESQPDLEQFVKDTLVAFGGLRRTNIIAKDAAANFKQLAPDLWEQTRQVIETLRQSDTISAERQAAHFIAGRYAGLGPKQSRNILQMLGLTRYEIPIDSRVIKWLNKFGFPFELSASDLSNVHYYELILDGIQQLCAQSDIYPCMLDAAIFASFDGDAWTPENAIW